MNVERSDLPTRKAAWTLAGTAAAVLLACGIVALFLALSGGLREPRPRPPASRDAPMLQTDEQGDRAAIEARAAARLRSGTPIGEAMRRTAAAGWDATP